MDKKSFLNKITHEDKTSISNIYEKVALAQRTGLTVFTNEFYTPNIWRGIENMSSELELNVCSFGVFKDAERRLLAFSNIEVNHFPVVLLRIEGSSNFVRLEHKDYLGALMSLGIKRTKMGDLLVKDNACYVPSSEELVQFISDNLSYIGKVPCKITVSDLEKDEIPEYTFQDLNINAVSFRADSIVSSICLISRSRAVEIIRNGKVLVDYELVTQKDKIIKPSSIITIRGYGKYKLIEEVGQTQRGRSRILIKKFI